ncbi:MAG: adenosylcobinamide-GDP ribazoletransferase [Proteobacteria bacterium]|nr:MAG: adenosylcobinamide-GDP ribazoletransferase [Pseudomonadota bacterium]
MNAFIASLQFITIFPLGRPRPFDARGILIHLPLAGLAIGLAVASFDLMAMAIWPPLVAGVLDVVLLAAITGALHLDGLADTADGLYETHDRERALTIMKDSRVGAMGLVAVVCLLLTKAVAVGHVDAGRFLAITIVPAHARAAMIFGIRFLPYARGKEGTGHAFFEVSLTLWDLRYVAIPLFLALFLEWRGLLLNLGFVVGTASLIWFYRRRLNGITGDLLGAMTEIMEALLFVAVCAGGAP